MLTDSRNRLRHSKGDRNPPRGGIAANSTDQPSAAKIANLDVYQQGVPTIFGFQLQLSLSATVNIVGAMDHPFNHLLWLLVNGDTQRASSAILESCDLERQVRDVQARC